MKVWLDEDLCSGCGNCTETAPEVFVHVEGLARVRQGSEILKSCQVGIVPITEEESVVVAAQECPGEIIFLEP